MVSKSQLLFWCGVVGVALSLPLWSALPSWTEASKGSWTGGTGGTGGTFADGHNGTDSSGADGRGGGVALAEQRSQAKAQNNEILSALASSQVIYLAETHNDLADHVAQLDIIQALDANGDIAIGLEMFQRPFQSALDDYLSGALSEEGLITASEYETRWGFDWEFYAPILRYAKENSIPLIALNTPAEITRKVAVTGLESLEGEDLSYIPPVAEVDLSDTDYREWISSVFNAHGGAGHSMNFDNFFAAQVLWDETMAERVVAQLTAQPDRQVIVLAGEGHVLNGYGIPDRVERRLPTVAQSSVQLVPSKAKGAPDAVDFVWVTDAAVEIQ